MNKVVLCAASSYEKNFYFNPLFDKLPVKIKEDLKKICVSYTLNCGGIFSLEFDEIKNLKIKTLILDKDINFDEISSELMIKKIQDNNEDLFHKIEIFYKNIDKFKE